MISADFNALAFWCGANLLLMLGLALNVSRLRIKNMRSPVDPAILQAAVRAHGNNIEYVPAALLGLLLVNMGLGAAWVHALGAALFAARLLHAIGIQQIRPGGPPPSRVIGNVGTWVVVAAVGITLITRSLT